MKKWFDRYKDLKIAVFGDYLIDEYLWIDAALNEPSLETGRIAYQCTGTESFPGASGTVVKNLANLGIGTVYAVGFMGDDARGVELCRGLDKLGVNRDNLIATPDRITPAHTKPWIIENGQKTELNRIDIKNWSETPPGVQDKCLAALRGIIKEIDALIILDHWVEENFGLITDRVRGELMQIAKENPDAIIFADSRARLGLFDGMILKGNQFEITYAIYGQKDPKAKLASDPSVERTDHEIQSACEALFKKTKKPVICTMGEEGALITHDGPAIKVPVLPAPGNTDVAGAGDMFSANFISALAAGADLESAGKIGNTAASLCVQQLGTSGYITTDDIIKGLGL